MKNGTYETRKEQIEKDLLRQLMRDLKAIGWATDDIGGRGRKAIAKALKVAAMVGACEERERVLRLADPETRWEITRRSVPDVLGYGDEKGSK